MENKIIRRYHVAYSIVGLGGTGGSTGMYYDEVELLSNEKCNYDTFYKKINSTLNKYNGYRVDAIISWSLIED